MSNNVAGEVTKAIELAKILTSSNCQGSQGWRKKIPVPTSRRSPISKARLIASDQIPPQRPATEHECKDHEWFRRRGKTKNPIVLFHDFREKGVYFYQARKVVNSTQDHLSLILSTWRDQLDCFTEKRISDVKCPSSINYWIHSRFSQMNTATSVKCLCVHICSLCDKPERTQKQPNKRQEIKFMPTLHPKVERFQQVKRLGCKIKIRQWKGRVQNERTSHCGHNEGSVTFPKGSGS